MLYTKFMSGLDAQKKLQAGINKLENAVGITLGAKGRLMVLGNLFPMNPHTTKDGVKGARFMALQDSEEQAGLELARGAAEKTVMQAGDGTTATIILTNAIVNEGIKAIEAGGNAVAIADGIKKSIKLVVDYIKKTAIQIDITDTTGPDYLTQVATISANGDANIGKLIADAYRKVGKDGMVKLGFPRSLITEVVMSQGVQIPAGYVDMAYATNHSKKTSELINPLVVIYQDKVTEPNHALLQGKVLYNICAELKRPLLFMCDGMDETTKSTLLGWKQTKGVAICVTTLPAGANTSAHGDASRKEYLKDIAALTGAHIIGAANGLKIAEATTSHAGEAQRVAVGKDFITFEALDSRKDAIAARAAEIRGQIEQAKTDTFPIPVEELQMRLAKLTSGIATIHPGAVTDLEARELFDRVEDSIEATKSAIEEGVVVGGGMCLFNAAANLTIIKNHILFAALLSPAFKIFSNSGADEEIKALEKIRNNVGSENFGYNAKSGQCEDLLQAGIIDSAKVVRCSIENASSVACQILLTQTSLMQVNTDIAA